MSSRSGRGATLSEKRRKLLAQRLKGRGGDRAASTIPRRTETGPVRLSFAQERLWFLDRWQPGTAVYNLPDVIRLRGRLRPELLAASLRMVLQRHEVLRTVFPQRDGVPYQVVQLCPAQPVTAVDLTGLTPADRRRAGEELISQEATRAFDLQTGPVVRFRLLRLAAKDHRLILNMHHIVADLWSFGILVQELGILYRSHCEGKRPPLEPLALQYADFALWQRQRLSGERLAGELGFWRRQLAGFPQVLELPSDRPRPVHLSSRGRSLSFRFRRFEASALKELAQHSEATLVMVLLAAFQALLGRLSGQRRFLLGSPVAGRTRSELEPLVGLFVNTLVLPTDLGGDPRFEDLVARARETLVDALSHQELPFERLVEELQPEREPSRPPLVQVLFAMQNAPVPALRLPELTLARADAETGTTKFDLTLFLGEEDGALGGALEYAEDLFDGTRMLRLVGQLETLLAAGVENPARRLGELPLLSPAEAQQLREWSRGPTEAPSEAPELPRLHQIFEHSAAAHGDTAAVLHGTVELTYRQVEAQANRLARVLRRRGVVPGALVGLCLERSPELVVAILAVLKSGAAYVPLDAAYPAERLGAMVDDAGLRKVITGGASGAALEPLASRRELDLLRLEELRGELEAASPKPPAAGSVPREGVGYVIFTSGSTGRPKGVALGQRVLASLMEWQESALPGPARTLQLAPVSFDVHCQEIFSTFRGGGTLVLVDEETRRDARALLHHLREHRVERLFLPFVALQQLSAAAEADGFICPALLDVITAGEQLQVDESLRDFFRRHPCCRLHNHYGPSESHVVTALSLSPEPAGWPTLPSIGRPVAAAAVRLGGRRLDPVPIGVDGELLLGRLAPAHGYTGRPALTAERFVPDPFTSRPGGRLYRTGDRARYLADGRLQFLGRWDHQVKVRGYRIEPGEIEAALRRHPAVEEAVVRLQHRGASHLLVAYLQGSAEPRDLRALLRRSLPEYMVPDSFVRLDALPLTPSGKVDRQALAAPEGPAGLARRCVAAGAESPAGAMVGPRDALESELVEIWAQVLGVDPSELGVEESFFSLGGHSLQTTRVAARIQGRWGVELPLRRLFDDPTIAGLAREVTRVLAGEARDGAPVIPRASRHRPLSLSFAQERLWFLHRLAPKAATYNIPVALRLEGELRVAPLAAALEQVRRRHEVLRTVYRSDAQGPRQEVLEEVPQALTVVDLQLLPAAAAETELQRLADREAARPFDLEKGPVMRCLLVRLGLAPQCHGLLLTVHHIAADGASLGLLVQETMELYRAMEAGGGPTAARLATLPIQYADYAVWQRERLRGELLESQMRYWRKRFDPLPKVLELPTDRPRPPV
ncbi:MAG: amino acid adenylation domain-containing protein, partial [Acidobacteriota bacterium]|nr:amino acid adenylation domain-containing protein [Acidobacteriota bacterium]